MCIRKKQQDLVLNDEITIKQNHYDYKHLSTNIPHDETLHKARKDRNMAGRKTITSLNSILWYQTINKISKRIYETLVKSITLYSDEVWSLKERSI